MKTTKIHKTIISMVLVACIMLAGNTITANAGNGTEAVKITKIDGIQNIYDIKDTTISMKVGDEQRFDLQKDYGSYKVDSTDSFELSTSDESVIQIEKRYWGEDIDKVACYLLRAKKPGTAVITCVNEWSGETVSFTINVKGATAKQKACKHVWKTTKKATCNRPGVKVCKKCKLTKAISQKKHQWETYETTKTVYDKYIVFICDGCTNPDPAVRLEHFNTIGGCDEWCNMEFSEREYGSREAALDALRTHAANAGHYISVMSQFRYDNPHKVKVTVTECKKCGLTPEEANR